MKRVAVICFLLLGGASLAHQSPSRRSIIVQAERGSVAVLVTWKPPRDTLDAIFASQTWGRSTSKAQKALEQTMSVRALAPLTFLLDGEPLAMGQVSSKLVEEPPRSGRPAVALLLSAKIPPGNHTLTVKVTQGDEDSRIQWRDLSRGRASCADKKATWKDAALPTQIEWHH